MPESEEALLRRAAKTVRARGRDATAGPWAAEMYDDGIPANERWMATSAPLEPVAVTGHDSWRDRLNAEWIALVSPALAEPLAAWLDAEADSCARLAGWSSINGHAHLIRAVRFARALLGEPALTAPVGDDRQEEK